MGSETRGQTLLVCYLLHAQRVKKEPRGPCTGEIFESNADARRVPKPLTIS